MKTETKSAEALAQELAERAMLKLNGGALVRRIILEETKLRELCACVEALREVSEFMEHAPHCPARPSDEYPRIGYCNCGLDEFRIKREQALAEAQI